ncbi:MAG: NusG domain II-containing protein [Caulobacteraceae bacterium]
MKKHDIVIIALILALAGVFLMVNYIRSTASGSVRAADVYVDGELYKSIPITKEEKTVVVVTDYGKNTVKVHDDGVEIIDADCPDKLCTGFGFKTGVGDQIVCLPHHLYIEVR